RRYVRLRGCGGAPFVLVRTADGSPERRSETRPVIRPADAVITEDDDFLAQALEHASIPTLMMSLVHLTGDTSLLRGSIRPGATMMGDVDGGMSADDKAAVRR